MRRVLIAALVLVSAEVAGQFKDQSPKVGMRLGGVLGNTGAATQNVGYQARAFVRHNLFRRLNGEFGAGYGEISGTGYKTQLVPVDYRLMLHPPSSDRWSPYVYLGFGGLYYEIQTVPINAPAGASRSGWTGLIPVGVGVQLMVDDLVAVDIGGGYNQSLSGGLDAIKTGKNDSYWNLMIGVAVVGETDPDPDRDGLLTKEEKPIGTDPLNPDTDGDGLNDREEVKGYKTNPLKPDTDGDGLKDGAEVKVYATDPLNPDSDADDLSDGDEVQRFETDPLKRDTDRDALADGAEVLRHKTSPIKIDTDGGTISDGVEVARGTNPLDPIDDVARKQTLKVEIGKPIILEGVVFKFGSAEITPVSDEILTKAFDTMSENPAIEVEIHGHTDNIGKPSYNLKLSQARASAVKVWLMKRGVAANRIVTKGFGSVKPIASNVTEEGRQRNRRIEFLRVR